eukprot:TRINITY_DN10909_c0_g1_i2.p1 TRINITY_DN10909_c0_g1~~TRINITY_DN10909_c0_g1_i2.p1  ORF type:complete len:684 (+),score=169.14 TRINITY_DN10909_c0_g1_i2:123-2174(+)
MDDSGSATRRPPGVPKYAFEAAASVGEGSADKLGSQAEVALPGLWEDIKAAWPLAVPDAWRGSHGGSAPSKSKPPSVTGMKGGLLLPLVAWFGAVAVWFAAPALRVENGSQDSCDPIRTYGEIDPAAATLLMEAVLDERRTGSLVDIGSGHGSLLRWACGNEGRFFERCLGVEVLQQRHEAALEQRAKLESAAADRLTLIHGDIVDNLGVLAADDLRVVFWNNLCFPAEVSQVVTQNFAEAASEGAKLVTLAELPSLPPRLRKRNLEVSLQMDWREEPYKPFEYTKEGLFKPERLQEMRAWLYDYVANHTAEAEECVVEFEYITGSKLILLGTSHLSRASTEFARQTVRDFRPECLVIERRLGDDSLQRLTIPEITYQDMIMGSTPTQLDQRDSFVDRVRKFHQDRVWLEGTEGWKEIGGEAAQSQEFGSAFEEFALQRINAKPGEDMGPRGGTLILGDADLRPIGMEQTSVGWSTFRPALSDFKKDGPNVPLRDLQMAQTLRAALKTHKRVVAVFGKDHLEGITHLLKQDKRVAVKREGIHIAPPMWLKDLEDGGKKWARAAAAPSSMFYQLAAAVEVAPIGTYLSGQAVMELYKTRQEADARMKKEGPQTDIVAPASSAIADDLISRSELLTPGSEDELKQWLRGENLIGREAGVFPFENPVQRRKAQALRGEKEEAKQDA